MRDAENHRTETEYNARKSGRSRLEDCCAGGEGYVGDDARGDEDQLLPESVENADDARKVEPKKMRHEVEPREPKYREDAVHGSECRRARAPRSRS
jgi:hypothetical protein